MYKTIGVIKDIAGLLKTYIPTNQMDRHKA